MTAGMLHALMAVISEEKIQNGRFRQIALASRGGKRHENIGLHYSLSNLNKVRKKKIIEK